MGPKKGRRVRKIEILIDSVPECELGDITADIQRRREEREAREREEAQQQPHRMEEARAEESHSQEEGHPEKRPRRERSDTETEAAGGKAGTSQSRYEKGHMTNVYLTDSDKEAIVDFVKDHEECTTRLVDISRTKRGRGVSGRSSPRVASCLPRCARPGLTHKGHVMGS